MKTIAPIAVANYARLPSFCPKHGKMGGNYCVVCYSLVERKNRLKGVLFSF